MPVTSASAKVNKMAGCCQIKTWRRAYLGKVYSAKSR